MSILNTSGTSDLRKQFAGLEVLSPDPPIPNTIVNNDELDLEDYEILMQSSQDQFIKTGKGKFNKFVEQKTRPNVRFKSEENSDQSSVLGKRNNSTFQNFQIRGGTKGNTVDSLSDDSALEETELAPDEEGITQEDHTALAKYYIEQRQKSSSICQGTKPINAHGQTWKFGKAMLAVENVLVTSIIRELEGFGCLVCMGHGHSKHACLTYKKVKKIGSNVPFVSYAYKLVELAISNRKMVKKAVQNQSVWPWFTFLVKTFNQQALDNSKDVRTFVLIQTEILKEYEQIALICIYCGGIGHGATEVIRTLQRQKQGVNLSTPMTKPGKEFVVKTASKVYVETPFTCPTKVKYEQMLVCNRGAHTAQKKAIIEYKKSTKGSADVTDNFDELITANLQVANNQVTTLIQLKYNLQDIGEIERSHQNQVNQDNDTNAWQHFEQEEEEKVQVPGQSAQQPTQEEEDVEMAEEDYAVEDKSDFKFQYFRGQVPYNTRLNLVLFMSLARVESASKKTDKIHARQELSILNQNVFKQKGWRGISLPTNLPMKKSDLKKIIRWLKSLPTFLLGYLFKGNNLEAALYLKKTKAADVEEKLGDEITETLFNVDKIAAANKGKEARRKAKKPKTTTTDIDRDFGVDLKLDSLTANKKFGSIEITV